MRVTLRRKGRCTLVREMTVRGWSRVLFDVLKELIDRGRRSRRHRFSHEHDWLRVSVLGGILLGFSTLALADALAGGPLFSDNPGHSFLFGGVAIVLFVLKIGRAEIYGDWIFNGLLYVVIGFQLSSGVQYFPPPTIQTSVLLLATGPVQYWIGVTSSPEQAGAWFRFSGCVGIGCGVSGLLAHFTSIPLTSLSLAAVDLLFLSISTMGFGLDCHDEHNTHNRYR